MYVQIWNILILLLDHNTSWCKHVIEKTCFVRPDWLLVKSKLVPGQTNDLPTDKNYLQACERLCVSYFLVNKSLVYVQPHPPSQTRKISFWEGGIATYRLTSDC